jgi:hypothetical protein
MWHLKQAVSDAAPVHRILVLGVIARNAEATHACVIKGMLKASGATIERHADSQIVECFTARLATDDATTRHGLGQRPQVRRCLIRIPVYHQTKNRSMSLYDPVSIVHVQPDGFLLRVAIPVEGNLINPASGKDRDNVAAVERLAQFKLVIEFAHASVAAPHWTT